MIIHRIEEGEDISSIARRYNTCPEKLAENNGYLTTDELILGDELLVAMPTRTYTVRQGDTLTALAHRFGVKKQELLAINPQLAGEENIYPGQMLAIKYERQNLGMAAANGYFTKDCKKDMLIRSLPYLVYVTFAVGITDGESIYTKKLSFDALNEVKSKGKIPLLRIYDGSDSEFLTSKTGRELLCERIVDAATAGGYSGVVFAACRAARERSEEYADFIFEVRKKMIGSELIFFTECDEGANHECIDLADGNILLYSKIDESESKSFESAEAAILNQYSESFDSSKTFLDIPAYACREGNAFIPVSEIRRLCRKHKTVIKRDEAALLSYIDIGKERIYFESLQNTKAKLGLVGELGFMGINIDIARTPTSHLMMFHTMFSPVCYNAFYSDM